MDLQEVRNTLQNSVPGRWLLLGASKLYGAAGWLNRFAYQNGWKTVRSVNSRVVCIGNITAGGTGKTTAVLLAATALEYVTGAVIPITGGAHCGYGAVLSSYNEKENYNG